MGSYGAPSLISGGWQKLTPSPSFSSECETLPLIGLTLKVKKNKVPLFLGARAPLGIARVKKNNNNFTKKFQIAIT